MTSLQKQLAAIAATSTHQLDLKAQKAAHGKSLLFEPKVAASQSFDSIYLICYEGFRDLCALDHRFSPFSRTLFSEQSKAEDRTQMTKEESEELDSVLEAFITLVGPKLLLKPAEKCLEWLVRRFHVHEYNTECLVLAYLQYHATPQFLALLSILPANPPRSLRFLSPYMNPPTNPPRNAIVYTATNTPTFFVSLQRFVVKAVQTGHQGSGLLSFWSGVTTQAIDAVLEQSHSGRREVQDQRIEELLLRVLPALNECLKVSHVSEAIMGSYMIIIVLVTKGAFEDKVLDYLMEAVIVSGESETLDACLMCMAIIAEERSAASLPIAVAKRLFRIPSLALTLQSLSVKCRVERLVLGCALAALDNVSRGIRLEQSVAFMEGLPKTHLLNESNMSIILEASLRFVRASGQGSSERAQLVQLVNNLSGSPGFSELLKGIMKTDGDDFESLGLLLQSSTEAVATAGPDSEDEEMFDVTEESEVPAILPPKITISTFLAVDSFGSFRETLKAFEQAVGSRHSTIRFLNSEELGRQKAFQTPLFLSFLIQSWCSPTSIPTKVAAIQAASSLIKTLGNGTDLQNLLPYLVYALTDASSAVRRAAATCISTLSTYTVKAEKDKIYKVWGLSDMYGKQGTQITALPKGQTSVVLSSTLVPILEECVMDPTFVTRSLRTSLEGASSSKGSQGHSLKSTIRSSLASFLASHFAQTPNLRTRLGLLPILNIVGKSMGNTRTNSVIPVIRSWCLLPSSDAQAVCEAQQLDMRDTDKKHLAALLSREADSVGLLKTILFENQSDRDDLQNLAFDRLVELWPSLRSESRQVFGKELLNAVLKEDCTTSFEENRRSRSLETLRAVQLDTATLLEFLESVPSAVQMPEGPPTKKRRRSSRNEIARIELNSSEDVNRLLRRLTLVLELIEGSSPGQHTPLLKNLFPILGDLQQLKQQSGSDLVYLQSLILGSLTPMVNMLKDQQDSSDSQSAIRADLLIDCIRHSSSPQVQNAALLLIASLASWVPDLVLHNLMPIFTFVGSTLLRQKDDYSAHVVDQTISRVVPQLAASLRAKQRNFLAGVSDLLLSFTAAFEHIPGHRRLKLFSELARTLGPGESLPAIIALLIDRYPASKAQRKFVPELLLNFEPMVTLETFKGYLDLVADAVGPKSKVSDTLFSLNEKQPPQVDTTVNNLLSSLADLTTEKSLHSHIGRAFRKSRDASKPRALFADIVETAIQISKSKSAVENRRLYETCRRVLANCLDVLPTSDLAKSSELLLTNQNSQVQVAAIKAMEVRAEAVTQNDQHSVTALLSFLPKINELFSRTLDVDVKNTAISCVDSIVERFGKKNATVVADIARTISGPQALKSNDEYTRILSLLCLTSIVDVLEDEAISLLPTVLPTAFDYLKQSIEHQKDGLHNAVFALLSNIVEKLSYMFSREYMVTALELAQRSACGDLSEECDESRQQFMEKSSKHLDTRDVFAAIKDTWVFAVSAGYEAANEQLALIQSTIENQPKSTIIKASSTLFSLLLDVFNIRQAIISAEDDAAALDEDEIEHLEMSLIDSVVAMTLKLNDTTFRPFFIQLVDFASSSNERSTTLCKFLAAFFNRFKSIVTSYASYTIEHLSTLLTHLAKPEALGEEGLRTAVLDALKRSFEHDQDGFWQAPSHYGAILKPLLQQLTIDAPLAITGDVVPAITELTAASSSSMDNHREMNAILLKYMRSEDAHTRLATVKCEQSLTKRLGEEWLSLLPEMLPFISELREDDDEMVERETQRWITMVEEILGEDLEGMLQ